MNYWINYLRTWVIIKRKHLGKKLSVSKNNNYTKFIILCAPRSGSNWLHTLLNSHPHIFSYGEALRTTVEKDQSKKLPPLNDLIFKPHQPNIKAVGLKLFYEYENHASISSSFKEIIADQELLVIHLVRKNVLSQFVSLKRAEESQQWSQSKKTIDVKPIHIDKAAFNTYKVKQIEKKKLMNGLFRNHKMLEISYEELNEDLHKSLDKIQEFLTVDTRALFSLLEKQTTGNSKNQILNWADFEESKTF